ncbi:MAG: hypothetical protein F6K28_44355, partial [Microcoleus sp. SIO2G3]|nr:hypothetical protein [Microcoleus sp. SIO2G3]
GDGAVLAVHFGEPGAIATYRYVQTSGYLAESEAGELLYGNYGMTAPGGFWNQWRRSIKNTANTSVIALDDRLLALWEGGNPHALDLHSLKTIGVDNLNGLESSWGYSAHPKQDVKTGEWFNFGVSPGANAVLHLYRSAPNGQIVQQNEIALQGVPLVHDFALAGSYLIFCIPPVRLNALPVLLGMSSFSDSLEWKPELGTQILVIDRHTLAAVSRSETQSWYQWHYGYSEIDRDGQIALTLVRYPDFTTNQYLKEVATGTTHTQASGALWRLRIDPHTGKLRSQEVLLDRPCEFPVTQFAPNADPLTYLTVHRLGADARRDVFGCIAQLNLTTGELIEADCGEHRYPSEALFAVDAIDPAQTWVLSLVYDGNTDRSEIWIFASDRLDAEPVCRLGLPTKIPLGFHGTWRADRSSSLKLRQRSEGDS